MGTKTAGKKKAAKSRARKAAAPVGMSLRAVERHPEPERLDYISVDLRPLAVPIHLVSADPGNLREHNDKNLRATMHSLRTYGQRKPIVCNVVQEGDQLRLVTEAGAGTLDAAIRLGWHYIAISRETDDEATARNYSVADNRTGDLSGWRNRDLLEHLRMQDMLTREALGFDDGDLQKLLKKVEGKGSKPDSPDAAPQLGGVKYRVVVEKLNGQLLSEAEQVALLQRLQAEGYTCTAPIH